MAEKNSADIGFEKQIWDAACVLREHIPGKNNTTPREEAKIILPASTLQEHKEY